jgi:hypothetical protein
LHPLAQRRTRRDKSLIINGLRLVYASHGIAPKRTKFQYEVTPVVTPEFALRLGGLSVRRVHKEGFKLRFSLAGVTFGVTFRNKRQHSYGFRDLQSMKMLPVFSVFASLVRIGDPHCLS